jgi:hypothetical protein
MFTQVFPEHRLREWRKLRNSFSANSNISDVVAAFGTPPEKTRYIDYYTPKHWPNVFDIVADGMFCQSGISLILAATIIELKLINAENIQFDVISSQLDSVEGLFLKHSNNYYNFIPGQISTEEYVKNNGIVFDTHIITVDKLFH